MKFCYWFENASLTQRVLNYLTNYLNLYTDSTTVMFLHDRWIIRLKLDPALGAHCYHNCQAFLREHGLPYCPPPVIALALNDLDAGRNLTSVMNRHQLVIVSHGAPDPDEIEHFRKHVTAGLGYSPQSFA